jgi:hypothetical protein
VVIKHCGKILASPQERLLKPTPSEILLGIQEVKAQEYWCSSPSCRKRLLYRQDVYQDRVTEWARIRPHQSAAFIARLRLAKESDWVWSYHPETFAKVKRTVR